MMELHTRRHVHWTFPLHLCSLVVCILFLNGVVLPVSHAQGEDTTLQGPCLPEDSPGTCVIGDKLGDPGDCTVYYECVDGTLELSRCRQGTKFDHKNAKCKAGKKKPVRCTPSCTESQTKTAKSQETPGEVIPSGNAGTQNDTTQRGDQEDVQTSVPTQPNEPQTTEEDNTDGVKAAGEFTKSNDTAVDPSQLVDPNKLGGVGASNDSTEKPVPLTEEKSSTTTTSTSTSTSTTSTTITTTTTTTTTTPTPTTTTVPPSPTTTTDSGVIVVVTDDGPEYDIATSPPGNSSGGAGAGKTDSGVSVATIGIAAGIIVALLIISVVVVLLICHVRRKKHTKEKQIVNIENPKYKKNGGDKHAYRFSRDASLLVNEKPANNNSTEKLAFIPGRKRSAPTPSKDKDKSKDKRKAPPPPNPFTGEVDDDSFRPTFRKDSSDLYERDTDASSGEEVEMSTFSPATSTFGTATGTFGKAWSPEETNHQEAPNGRVQQSRSTDYSSEDEEDSDEEATEALLNKKPAPAQNDDSVFKDDSASRDVNKSMDAYLSAYDQALK